MKRLSAIQKLLVASTLSLVLVFNLGMGAVASSVIYPLGDEKQIVYQETELVPGENSAEEGEEENPGDGEDINPGEGENPGPGDGEDPNPNEGGEDNKKEGEGDDESGENENGPTIELESAAEGVGLFANPVSDFGTLKADIESAVVNTEVVVDGNFDMTDKVTIPAGIEITLKPDGGGSFTLGRDATFVDDVLFEVPATATLVLEEGVTISGNNVEITAPKEATLVLVEGTLVMNGGVLTGSVVNAPTDRTDPSDNNSPSPLEYYIGSPVAVLGGGSFTMNGGAITQNSGAGGAYYTGPRTYQSDDTVQRAGGVFVGSGGTFKMQGGSIDNNRSAFGGGGVAVRGSGSTFVLDAGRIEENNQSNVGLGGGVAVLDGGTLRMSGTVDDTVIASNRASKGGGIYQGHSGATIVIDGGNIQSNTASFMGGGICIDTGNRYSNSLVQINRVTIQDNVCTNYGGGIYIESGSGAVLKNLFIFFK